MSTRHRRLMRLILITLLALTVLAILPVSVYACSGFLDCLFGFSERTEIRAERDVETARINAQRDAEAARIQGEADQRIAEAQAEVERIRNARYADEQQAKIAIAAAEAQAAAFIAQTNALVAERIRSLEVNADSQMAALQAQAQIAIAGIHETGETQRHTMTGYYTLRVVGLLILGAGLIVILTRRRPQPYHVLPAQPHQVAGPAYNQRQIDGQAYTLPVRQRNNEVSRHEQHWQ